MAAGYGSRLSGITNGNPKSFLNIGNETLLERSIRLLKNRGIKDIIVVGGYEINKMEHLLEKHSVRLLNNPLYFCTNVLASFAISMNFLKEDFIFLHADTIFDPTILDDLLISSEDITLPIDFKECGEEEMKVIVGDESEVKEINKTMNPKYCSGEFIGLAKIRFSLLGKLKKAVLEELIKKQNYNEYFEAALQNLISKKEKISSFNIDGRNWVEIDFPDDYKLALDLFENEEE